MSPDMRDRVEGPRSVRSLRNGLLMVAPLWAILITLIVLAVVR